MKEEHILVIIMGVLVVVGLLGSVWADNVVGSNYKNVTVHTTVNVTSAQPEIMRIIVDENITPYITNITLNAGLTRQVLCNVTVRDWNGIDDNITLNASFFYSVNTSVFDPDLNSSHYTNTSCPLVAGPYGQNNVYANYTCTFDVYYFANNGTWNCTAFVLDTRGDYTGQQNYTVNKSNSTIVDKLFALNVTDGIDYGQMGVGEYSGNITSNVTNFGNVPINLTVQGYGNVRGDNLAFVCNSSVSAWNISVQYEAVSINESANFTEKMALNGTVQKLANLTIPRPTDENQTITNVTYWQVYLPTTINPYGVCNGWVIFSAEAP
ncbi:MAG: hypothetical protein V1725_03615 [archaeon]